MCTALGWHWEASEEGRLLTGPSGMRRGCGTACSTLFSGHTLGLMVAMHGWICHALSLGDHSPAVETYADRSFKNSIASDKGDTNFPAL